jgi:dihydrofolate synthase/folylpolyglutamate synthase
LAGLLECADLKVGLFTSPHLVDIRERFQINGRMISKELFVEAVCFLKQLLEQTEDEYKPCFFDMMFFIGMYAFQKEKVDILILETGLGGRLDATNAVVDKVLTLVTHIALDHTEYLGDTLELIAMEKAGIMKAKVPCVVGLHNEKVKHIFMQKSTELESVCRILDKEVYGCQRLYEKSVAFSYFSSYYGTIPIVLNTQALYQIDNVCLALAGLECLIEQQILSKEQFSVKKLQQALFATKWGGRMEEILPNVFLDGAHNVDGIESFLSSVKSDTCSGRRFLVFSAVSDKEYDHMLQLILKSELFAEVVVTEVFGERGVSAEKLLKAAKGKESAALCVSEPEFETAIFEILTKQQQLDYIYIVGSLYLVGQTKKLLSNHVKFSESRKGEPE